MNKNSGWIGVDLDGTLAEYTEWKGIDYIGPPIPAMVDRVRKWLDEGKWIKIFTARVSEQGDPRDITKTRYYIGEWCLKHLGRRLEVTNVKDYAMIMLYMSIVTGKL